MKKKIVRQKGEEEKCFLLSYRGHGDRDVQVLASIVLLVSEEVVPNLKNAEKDFEQISQKRIIREHSCPFR